MKIISENGRNELSETVKEPYLSAILSIWNHEKNSENIAVKSETKSL